MKLLDSLTRGDKLVLVAYGFCAIAGLVVFALGLGYDWSDRLSFGAVTIGCVILTFVYLLLCDTNELEEHKVK